MDTLHKGLAAMAQGYVTVESSPPLAVELASTEALGRAADEVPRIEPVRRPSGLSITALYAEILEHAIVKATRTEPPPIADARQLLYADERAQVPSQRYRTYLRLKEALDQVRAMGRRGDAEWTALQAAQPGRIEAALAMIAQHQERDLGAAFSAARESFAGARREGASKAYYPCDAVPPKFWARPPQCSGETSSQPLTFERVRLERPWLRLQLLARGGWSVPGRAPGAYSNGRADESNLGLLPLVPIALFLGWTQDGTAIIVGWDNAIVPYCPQRGAA